MTEDEKLECYYTNNPIKEVDNLDEAMIGYKANDEARICRFTRPNGTCFKGARCKLEHERPRPDGVTTDKLFVYTAAFNKLRLPCAGDIINLQVTNVLSINSFYACRIEDIARTNYSPELLNLINEMNREDTIRQYKRLAVDPTRGEIVIAKSWNGKWYRAQVQDVFCATDRKDLTIQVFMVDFGELVDVTVDNARQITPEYLHLPFQAIYCRLYNVKPIDGEDKEAAKDYFESHFLCQTFIAEVKYSSYGILEVLLTKRNSSDDVGQQIIDDQFGELQTEHFFPRDCETLLVD